jgi:hypothetical protein
VRLAFKLFELNIPFDNKDPSGVPIDAQSEPVYKSHVDKIDKMKDWKDSPFCCMRVEQRSNGFMLKLLAMKVDCEKCTTAMPTSSARSCCARNVVLTMKQPQNVLHMERQRRHELFGGVNLYLCVTVVVFSLCCHFRAFSVH